MTTTPQAALLISLKDSEFWPADMSLNKWADLVCDELRRLDAENQRLQALLAKLQPAQEPAQAGELPEPDAVFYCSEDTGYLTQYRRPPANLTDGDVAMYEADTVRSLLISAALAARKPLMPLSSKRVKDLVASVYASPNPEHAADFINGIRHGEIAHGIGINGLEVKP